MLTKIPDDLRIEDIHLVYEKTVPGDISRGLVPFYHFKILDKDSNSVGHINFRVGDTPHVLFTAGHIGFEVLPQFRGKSYAYKACKALIPFVKSYYDKVIVTADPSNVHSRRIIEKLGAVFIDEVEVSEDDPGYLNGARRKARYEWVL